MTHTEARCVLCRDIFIVTGEEHPDFPEHYGCDGGWGYVIGTWGVQPEESVVQLPLPTTKGNTMRGDEFKKYVVTYDEDGNLLEYVEVDDSSLVVHVHENDVPLVTPRSMSRAGEYECFSVQNISELWAEAEPELVDVPSVALVAQVNAVDVNALIADTAKRLQEIYDMQTAGDWTFVGVVADMLLKLEGR